MKGGGRGRTITLILLVGLLFCTVAAESFQVTDAEINKIAGILYSNTSAGDRFKVYGHLGLPLRERNDFTRDHGRDGLVFYTETILAWCKLNGDTATILNLQEKLKELSLIAATGELTSMIKASEKSISPGTSGRAVPPKLVDDPKCVTKQISFLADNTSNWPVLKACLLESELFSDAEIQILSNKSNDQERYYEMYTSVTKKDQWKRKLLASLVKANNNHVAYKILEYDSSFQN